MNCKTVIFLACFQCLCLVQPKEALFVNRKSLSENIQDGLVFAGKIFGIDHASEIADMVANTFSNKSKQHKYQNRQDDPGDYNNHNTLMISNILQLIGLDSAKIGALAVNGIIFIAQVIGRSLVASFTDKFTAKEDTTESPPPSARKLSDGSPLDWFLQIKSPILTNTMNELRNSSLPERLVDMFEEKDGNTDCIKLLVCKMSPLIWGMQRACNATIEPEEQTDEIDVGINGKGLNSFYKYLPDMQEFSTHGDACESRYDGCKVAPPY
ncbi:uncharacterized protein LOC119069263 [Bradysia coprophila]|uniref:uncharacterized protein LOC119069263 n=1 Tax=Bradysia coprophila TaxID=38358 RepID=UPI00187DD087|nr:uncharacterized protein LOC119069263 [Bradysia coprophila]